MCNDLAQAVTDKLRCAKVAGLEAAPVRITDKTGRVRYQDHALRVVQDLDIEIAFTLQLRLEFLRIGDVQNHSAILDDFASGILDRKSIDQSVNEGAVFSSE